ARKRFEKASQWMAKENWDKAKDELTAAVTIYPQYADAYNNLGVVYARLGDRVQERQALERAVTLNDHLAPAFVNLAKMDIREHNFPKAEVMLQKAATADPNDTDTLLLLANTQLMNHNYEQAISTCRKVHLMPHEKQTLVHVIAARALEVQQKIS